VIIASNEKYEIPENLKKTFKRAINDVKESPEILRKVINDVKELSEHQVKKYFQEFDQQLKDFDNKVLKIKDFDMIDLAFNILFNLANLKTKIFSFIEKMDNFNLEVIFSNEFVSLINEIDKHLKPLSEWKNICIKIINQFKVLNNFIENIKDNLFYFEIQEKLLIKMDEMKNKLLDKSKNIDEYELKKRVVLDFLNNLNYELEQVEDLMKVFKKSELCLKDYWFDYIVK
ncbi:16282_t:CDS:2, partial [Cetraspora pellucida]